MFHIYFETYLRPDKGTGKGKSSGSGRNGGRGGRGGKGARGSTGSSGSRQRWQDRAGRNDDGHETGDGHEQNNASWRRRRTHHENAHDETAHDETAHDETVTAEAVVDSTVGPAANPIVIPDVIPDATAEERSPEVMPDNFNVVGDNFAANAESLCIICNSDFGRSRLVMGRCLHKFHDKCIRDWWRLASIAPTCPSCRQPAENFNLIRMQWQPMAATGPPPAAEIPAVETEAANEGAHAMEGEASGAEAVAAVIEAASAAAATAEAIVVEDSTSPMNHAGEGRTTEGEPEAEPAVASTSSSSRVPKRISKKTPDVPRSWS